MPARSLIAIVTPAFGSPESVEALKREVNGAPTEVRMVAPAVEINPLHHTLGDIDEPRERAGERLKAAVAAARDAGLDVSFEVGDPDPVQAVERRVEERLAGLEDLLKAHLTGRDPAGFEVSFERERRSLRDFDDRQFRLRFVGRPGLAARQRDDS